MDVRIKHQEIEGRLLAVLEIILEAEDGC